MSVLRRLVPAALIAAVLLAGATAVQAVVRHASAPPPRRVPLGPAADAGAVALDDAGTALLGPAPSR